MENNYHRLDVVRIHSAAHQLVNIAYKSGITYNHFIIASPNPADCISSSDLWVDRNGKINLDETIDEPIPSSEDKRLVIGVSFEIYKTGKVRRLPTNLEPKFVNELLNIFGGNTYVIAEKSLSGKTLQTIENDGKCYVKTIAIPKDLRNNCFTDFHIDEMIQDFNQLLSDLGFAFVSATDSEGIEKTSVDSKHTTYTFIKRNFVSMNNIDCSLFVEYTTVDINNYDSFKIEFALGQNSYDDKPNSTAITIYNTDIYSVNEVMVKLSSIATTQIITHLINL